MYRLPQRKIVRALYIATFAAAVAAVSVHARYDAALGTAVGRVLVAVAVVFIAIAVRYSVPIRGRLDKRAPHIEDSVSLDLPITLSLLVVVGGTAAAIAVLVGFPLSAFMRRRADNFGLAFAGASRALFFVTADLFRPNIPRAIFDYTLPSFGIFLAAVSTGMLAYIYLWHIPAAAWCGRISLQRLWRRYIRDRHVWSLLACQTIWAYACCEFMLRGGPLLGLLAWLPVPTIGFLGRSLYLARSDLARMRMTRDAITAMLVERDPIPQISSVVASALGESRETVQVVASIGSADREWRVVTSIGPPSERGFEELRARAIARLHSRQTRTVTVMDDFHTIVAAGAYDDEGRLVGALCALRDAGSGYSRRVDRLIHVARELAPLLRDLRDIGRAQEAAEVDPLTRLANRATILEHIRATIETQALPGALLLLDIDNFKEINDQLGHLAGDRCLRTVGEIVAQSVRGDDRAGRIGGEEFLIVMPHASNEGARAAAERLREAIESCGLRHADGKPITCSIGIAALEVGSTLESTLARADTALYAAKRQGRNRVIEIPA
ncbi:MAG: diguanylate cyclase domain-containing protein [Vulcanimicrobiaceae bacterium]